MDAPIARPGLVAGLLAFVSGYVDTVGFIALFGLFTAHVTGNFVLLGASLAASSGAGVIAKLAALPVFVLVVSLTALFVGARAQLQKSSRVPLLLVQILLLAAFAGTGLAATPVADADAPLAVLAGLLGVAAMAVHNAMSRLSLADLPPTTVMTGNVTQFAIDATTMLLAKRDDDHAAARARLKRMFPPVAAFATGAIGGALAFVAAGFAALALPIAALALSIWLLERKP